MVQSEQKIGMKKLTKLLDKLRRNSGGLLCVVLLRHFIFGTVPVPVLENFLLSSGIFNVCGMPRRIIILLTLWKGYDDENAI